MKFFRSSVQNPFQKSYLNIEYNSQKSNDGTKNGTLKKTLTLPITVLKSIAVLLHCDTAQLWNALDVKVC